MAVTSTTQLSADLQTYFSKNLLEMAEYSKVLDRFGYTENIPSNSSKTISFTQYGKLAVATSPLTEGVPPTDTQLSTTPITATIDQLGAYVTLTDLAQLTPKHPVMQQTNKLLADQAAETYDRSINSVIVGGTTVRFGGGAASNVAMTSTSYITMSDILALVVTLRKNGAKPWDDGNFVCVLDASAEGDLMQDTQFANTVYRQADPTKGNELYKGTIATFYGVRFVRSTNLPTITAGSGGSLVGHTSYVFGQNGYAVTNLQNLAYYKEGPGSVSDPLHQKMTLGWKVGFKTVILNNAFFGRIESVSRY